MALLLTEDAAEVQRGYVTYSRSHSYSMTEPGLHGCTTHILSNSSAQPWALYLPSCTLTTCEVIILKRAKARMVISS